MTILSDKEQKAELGAILSLSRDAIVMMDNQGKITFWNKGAEQMLGYSESEVLNKDLHEVLAAQAEHRTNRTNLNHFFDTGESSLLGKIIEVPVKTKSGKILILELAVSGTKIKDKWSGVGVMRDVTELKNRIKELEKLNQIMVDRELKMLELKKENLNLKQKLTK